MTARCLGCADAAHLGRCQQQRRRVDVGEHGRRAGVDDRLGGRDERHRRHDDLVAGADAERPQREHQGVGARAAAGGSRDVVGVGERLLEAGTGPADERARVDDVRSIAASSSLRIDAWSRARSRNGMQVMAVLPGLPTTVAPGGTSRTTTAPAPTRAPAPTTTPGSRTTPAPDDGASLDAHALEVILGVGPVRVAGVGDDDRWPDPARPRRGRSARARSSRRGGGPRQPMLDVVLDDGVAARSTRRRRSSCARARARRARRGSPTPRTGAAVDDDVAAQRRSGPDPRAVALRGPVDPEHAERAAPSQPSPSSTSSAITRRLVDAHHIDPRPVHRHASAERRSRPGPARPRRRARRP